MAIFLDLRLNAVGGGLASTVAVNQLTPAGDYQSLDLPSLLSAINGRHVLLCTHGFNVDRQDGIDSLANWASLLQMPQPFVAIGILWPGDSVWAHGLDYPAEPRIADDAGQLLAPFIDRHFASAASIAFASHSLGARVVLETASLMTTPIARTILMAGAIDDNCLNTEFQPYLANFGNISVLASKKDEVLAAIFPLGNFLAGILTQGHPWWHAALGHCGPSNPRPASFQAPFQIPDTWNFGHGDYLKIDPAAPAPNPIPTAIPPQGTPQPANPGWQEAFTAAFASTRLR